MPAHLNNTATTSPVLSGVVATEQQMRAALDNVYDPELPNITIKELGILRDVDIDDKTITVWITPTWSGCPAIDEITENIKAVLAGYGRQILIKHRLSPAWTSQWLSQSARDKLVQMNITPPVHGVTAGKHNALVREHRIITCPRCGHRHTREVSECGSTACKALYSCPSCRNVFEYFKDI